MGGWLMCAMALTTSWHRSAHAPRPRTARVVHMCSGPSVPITRSSAWREDTAPVQFKPSFKAARRALGVRRPVGQDQIAEYVVNRRTSQVEMRAMLHGLTSTGQLEPAVRVLDEFVRLTRKPGEQLPSIVLNACAERGRMDLYAYTPPS